MLLIPLSILCMSAKTNSAFIKDGHGVRKLGNYTNQTLSRLVSYHKFLLDNHFTKSSYLCITEIFQILANVVKLTIIII